MQTFKSHMISESALNALRTATKAHKGQFRKSGGEYIAHPKEVAKIVAKFKPKSSNLSALVQAAYLHDTVEDTDLTHSDLVKQFGGLVANLVDQLTTKKDDLEAAGGKGEYIKDKMVNMTSWALVIKLADRLANVSDIRQQKPAWQKKYAGDTKLALDAVKKDRKDLSPTHKKIIKNIENIIQPYV
jgi:GTP diphosphokinase / guanosine-3',5'-bis(diphosphate) 3'-diphosphatase|tara:strand:- start:725 stop:1282 length:558 start_codon:yes stop_codon:yes gene_type:complete